MSKRVIFVTNRDFVLYNFRFELVEKLINMGYETYIYLPYGPKVDLMTDIGAKFIPMAIDKRGTNPIKDVSFMREMKRIFKEVRPDIILLYTTKVDIYGGIIAGKMKIPHIINISGLGTATGERGLLQKLLIFMYRKAVAKADCVFFQNTRDRDFFVQHRMYVKKGKMLPGSGVNFEKWKLLPYPDESDGIHFLFTARIIKQKGIEEYLECARRIKEKYENRVTFHVLGPCDGDYQAALDSAQKNGIIIYHGMVQDTGEFLKKSHCQIHPSFYPEGISNVCLEAAASGRAVITTDQNGCRETVDDGVTGYIVPCRNVDALTEAVEKFMKLSFDERVAMGVNARQKVKKQYDRMKVIMLYTEEIKEVLEQI